jgi:recombination protein RecA
MSIALAPVLLHAHRYEADYRPTWAFSNLAGRLCELSSTSGAGLLSAAFHIVLDAQTEGEPVAWVSAVPDLFFPPDVAEAGIDVEAMVVVRSQGGHTAGRICDRLLRSGAFGLCVLDFGENAFFPQPLQARLLQLARLHRAGILCLTQKDKNRASLSSLVSLRGHANSERLSAGRFRYSVDIVKDKRGGPGWNYQEMCHGPAGVR